MRIFVTGATGFIGTELVKELIAAGHQVRGLTRRETGAHELEAAGAEAHHGNLKVFVVAHRLARYDLPFPIPIQPCIHGVVACVQLLAEDGLCLYTFVRKNGGA